MKTDRIQSHSRCEENIRIVKELISELKLPYFTGREIARRTGISPHRVGVGLRFLHKQGYVEKVSIRVWKKTPEKKAGMRQKMQEFASKHKLIINPYAETKIEWMEKHERRCYCEPDGSRICPCKFCLNDIKEFNGCCLCRVFVTEDKLKRIEKYQKQKS